MLKIMAPGTPEEQRQVFLFRHRVFVDYAGWDLPARDGLECDEFDTPHSVHLVYQDDDARILGLTRLLPTNETYMIESLWPHLLENIAPPKDPRVWEISRLGVEPELPGLARLEIIQTIVLACLEFALARSINTYLAVIASSLARRITQGTGGYFSFLGPENSVGGHKVHAVQMIVSEGHLVSVQNTTGKRDVLSPSRMTPDKAREILRNPAGLPQEQVDEALSVVAEENTRLLREKGTKQ